MRKLVFQSIVIIAFSSGIALATNQIRPDGIPVVAKTAYDIFAPCRDSEASGRLTAVRSLGNGALQRRLFVDARPGAAFAAEHAEQAVNIPYSVLFGASAEAVETLGKAIRAQNPESVVVYGAIAQPDAPGQQVDLARPLAAQLTEAGIQGVTYLEGGLDALKKAGARTVQAVAGDGGAR